MPAKMCVPLKKMGMYLIDLAVNCAAEAIIPGAGTIIDAIKMGKKILDKLGVMKLVTKLKNKVTGFIMEKLLGIFGCKFKRRMFKLFKKLAGAAKKAVKFAKKTVKKVAKTAVKVAKKVGSTVINGYKGFFKFSAKMLKVLCPVVKPLCAPGCFAAVTAFKSASLALEATYHIPLGCIAPTLKKLCLGLCHKICGRRRLAITQH
jgi:hypothetical protein